MENRFIVPAGLNEIQAFMARRHIQILAKLDHTERELSDIRNELDVILQTLSETEEIILERAIGSKE
jgi:hypothetical protein